MKTGWLAVLFVIAIGFGFAVGAGVVAQRITSDFSGTMALGGVTLIATTWLALWQFDRTKKKEAEARIFAERALRYQSLIHILRDLLFSTKGWTDPVDSTQMAKKMAEITYDMTIWGGQDTIRALMRLSDNQNPDPGAVMGIMSNLFGAIRKDLGHSDDAALSDDLVLQMVTAEDRAKVAELLRQHRV